MMIIKKKYQADEGKVEQVVNRGRPGESEKKASHVSARLLSLI